MNLDFIYLLDGNFHPSSRVWIYQSNRLFTLSEALEAETMLHEFVHGWVSHQVPVKGEAHLFFGQFIVLLADETAAQVGGCSTDSSVRVIKEIEKKFGVNMFDRTSLAFVINDKVQLLPMTQLGYAVENNFINADTMYFNNTVLTKSELETNWIIPVKQSWLAKKVNFPAVVL